MGSRERGLCVCVWGGGVALRPGSPALSVTCGAWAQPLSLLELLHTTLGAHLREAEQTARSAPQGGQPG